MRNHYIHSTQNATNISPILITSLEYSLMLAAAYLPFSNEFWDCYTILFNHISILVPHYHYDNSFLLQSRSLPSLWHATPIKCSTLMIFCIISGYASNNSPLIGSKWLTWPLFLGAIPLTTTSVKILRFQFDWDLEIPAQETDMERFLWL